MAVALRQERLKRGTGAEHVDERRQGGRALRVSDHTAKSEPKLLEATGDIAKITGPCIADDGERLAVPGRPSRRGPDGAGDGNEPREQQAERSAIQNSGFDFHSASFTSASYSSPDIERFA